MKHTAQITFDRATCSCNRVPAIWRRDGEAIGTFTLRAYDCWRIHADLNEARTPVDLFDYRAEIRPDLRAHADLFS